ncbi:hypothetical protein Tco_1291051, partial [Tanacetum coccineum]
MVSAITSHNAGRRTAATRGGGTSGRGGQGSGRGRKEVVKMAKRVIRVVKEVVKDYDGKGGAIVYTRWIEKMESVQDMSGYGENQKVKYT